MGPTLASIQSRLTTSQTLLLERSRIVSLSLPPSASSTAQINRNLQTIRADLVQLENELKLEAGGLSVGGTRSGTKGEAEIQSVLEAWDRYDQLVEMFEEDDIGRERAKGLKRVIQQPEPVEHPDRSGTSTPGMDEDDSVLGFKPPSPIHQPVRPFRDDPEDEAGEEGFNQHDMLAQQQQLMDDQDERLNFLSHSIGRQNHLSVQIGSELDLHHDLLEDTDAAMDRTAARLHRARRRLNKVADEAKQHGSTITIVGLILVLLILIIVFKT